jgi:hypothetical protein
MTVVGKASHLCLRQSHAVRTSSLLVRGWSVAGLRCVAQAHRAAAIWPHHVYLLARYDALQDNLHCLTCGTPRQRSARNGLPRVALPREPVLPFGRRPVSCRQPSARSALFLPHLLRLLPASLVPAGARRASRQLRVQRRAPLQALLARATINLQRLRKFPLTLNALPAETRVIDRALSEGSCYRSGEIKTSEWKAANQCRILPQTLVPHRGRLHQIQKNPGLVKSFFRARDVAYVVECA